MKNLLEAIYHITKQNISYYPSTTIHNIT